jgi:hypothetical protein
MGRGIGDAAPSSRLLSEEALRAERGGRDQSSSSTKRRVEGFPMDGELGRDPPRSPGNRGLCMEGAGLADRDGLSSFANWTVLGDRISVYPFSRCFRMKEAKSAQLRGESLRTVDLSEDGTELDDSVGDGFWVRITGITGDGFRDCGMAGEGSASDAFRGARDNSGDGDPVGTVGLLSTIARFRVSVRDSYSIILAAKL